MQTLCRLSLQVNIDFFQKTKRLNKVVLPYHYVIKGTVHPFIPGSWIQPQKTWQVIKVTAE